MLVDPHGRTLEVGDRAFFFLGNHPTTGGRVLGKVTKIDDDRIEVAKCSIPRSAIIRFVVTVKHYERYK